MTELMGTGDPTPLRSIDQSSLPNLVISISIQLQEDYSNGLCDSVGSDKICAAVHALGTFTCIHLWLIRIAIFQEAQRKKKNILDQEYLCLTTYILKPNRYQNRRGRKLSRLSNLAARRQTLRVKNFMLMNQ